MTTFPTVVVGVDLRSGGQDAIALARALAPDARLILAHSYTLGTTEAMAELTGWDDACREGALDVLSAERRTAHVDAALEVRRDRSPAHALESIAARRAADLIVVGSAHHGRLARVLLGDVGRSLIQDAPCPVAIAPRELDARRPAVIGVGVDGSPESREAVALAAKLAAETGARLDILVVIVPPDWVTPTVDDWPQHVTDERLPAQALLDRETARTDIPTGGELLEGNAANQLARRSEHLDLLVVGSRRWGPVGRVLGGSTSDRLAHSASCPLIVVPRPLEADAPSSGQLSLTTA